MIFGYPTAALSLNWLHDSLLRAVEEVHALAERGEKLPEWPRLFPDKLQPKLKPKHGFKSRFDEYHAAVLRLSTSERQDVANAIRGQNDVQGLLAGVSSCARANDLPEAVRQPALNLFEFAFHLLTDLKVRDDQYKIVYDAIDRKECPFCGIEALSAQGGLREPLDHYLARSIYPFAAANLENLPPMGRACNSIKREKDVLLGSSGRRRAFYPWTDRRLRVSFAKSASFAGGRGRPAWTVAFDPASDEAETWNELFDVRARYMRELDEHFLRWIAAFAQRTARRLTSVVDSNAEVVQYLEEYCAELEIERLIGIDSLRLPVFEWVLHACRGGDLRLLHMMRDQINDEHRHRHRSRRQGGRSSGG